MDRSHPVDNDFRLVVDAKYTEKKSFSIKAKQMDDWVQAANTAGRRFAMPIRFWEDGHAEDYVVLSLDDFTELLEKANGISS